ncbi:MAG: hypothetical protein J7J67_00635, partial [Thermoproteales archaeon]|nr:hypothetical protein [Thermoproteales archaeon]
MWGGRESAGEDICFTNSSVLEEFACQYAYIADDRLAFNPPPDERFRRYALRRGLGVGRALEELLREELFLEDLGDALLGLAGGE